MLLALAKLDPERARGLVSLAQPRYDHPVLLSSPIVGVCTAAELVLVDEDIVLLD